MNKYRLLHLLVIVMLVLPFAVYPAAAQYEPQVGTVDEDGDLVVGVLPPTIIGTGKPGDDRSLVDQLPGTDASVGVMAGADTVPVSPGGFTLITDKTPTFTFTRDAAATMYQIEVWNVNTSAMVYSIKDAGDCTLTQCSITPTIKLKSYDITGTKGFYLWSVRSKTGAGWGGYSSDVFYVMSTGFTSTFDLHSKKWEIVNGDWFRVDPGYLKSTGVLNSFTSVLQKEYFIDDYVYTVRMKGKGGTNQTQGLIIGGEPAPLGSANFWYDGLYFLYRDGSTGVQFVADGILNYWSGWYEDDDLDPTGWNVLEVVVESPNATFLVNGQPAWQILNFPTDVEPGYVGIAHFKFTTEKAPLLIDWAKLSYMTSGSIDGMDLDGARVIDFNNLSQYTSQSVSPFDPPE